MAGPLSWMSCRSRRIRIRSRSGPFFGSEAHPGERIPSMGEKIARPTKPNAKLEKADRLAHRVIAKKSFEKLDTIKDVITKLVGV
jgi:hypothetical protein